MVGLQPSLDAGLIPPLILFSIPIYLVASRLYKSFSGSTTTKAYDPSTGIGRGAPGFQTNTRRVKLPAELVARIKRGEEVSAEEVTAALEKQKRLDQDQGDSLSNEGQDKDKTWNVPESVDQDWLPKQQQSGGNASRRRKR
ncbi:hypothetical protein ACM66B_000448 [Microbotryomycetes sp. NB124-2]